MLIISSKTNKHEKNGENVQIDFRASTENGFETQ